jgi:hypothetical protein
MVMRECKRQVSFLIAEKSMHQRGIGTFAKMVNASKSWAKKKIAGRRSLKIAGILKIFDKMMLNLSSSPFSHEPT